MDLSFGTVGEWDYVARTGDPSPLGHTALWTPALQQRATAARESFRARVGRYPTGNELKAEMSGANNAAAPASSAWVWWVVAAVVVALLLSGGKK